MSTRFTFRAAGGVIADLEVHEPGEHASLEQVYGSLLAMRVQLVHAAEHMIGGTKVLRLSVCELDGAPVKPARRRAIIAELSGLLIGGNVARAVDSRTESSKEPQRAA